MLKLHNSLSDQKEIFQPIQQGKVSMYVCGMTVYDYCHIGHARVMVVFDMINRFLRHLYGAENVLYVRNITDIDDKIINRANENNEDFNALTERFIQAMHEDEQALNVLKPDLEPRATTHMESIIAMIDKLVEKQFAYIGDNGDVFYRIEKFKKYGRLANKNLDELRSGHRVEVENSKQNPLDFVLWKKAKEHEPSWDSPWGKGRPGWHIECSAMSTHCLGNHFDIHGGGQDLKFPHHENEIAQSEASTGESFVNYWLHNGFVNVDGEKMAKSVGNFFIIRDVLKTYAAEVVRFFILSSHYRSPLNYSDVNLEQAKSALSSLYQTLLQYEPEEPYTASNNISNNDYVIRFEQALKDDFNTPIAIAILFEINKAIHKNSDDKNKQQELIDILKQLASLLGLLSNSAKDFLQDSSHSGELSEQQINVLINQRAQAKKDKNWARCDEIRVLLQNDGIILEDSPQGTRWRRG